ncbi:MULTISPECIES: DUF3108 domain-containing protein [Roseivirga]|uniref:DUF3108 domain-containing protein n=1 Tax=Roseivirga spongicola TaxID=333140 RepID=A0A150XA57_9BACT|nr:MULTISPECIES: DUF3108 domain-containing protein [Roseivirga]KYG75576.1 hypothetical protein AWW68_06990 [Roseivirga spongicola]MBO6494670.1 DUF3108 domain-containing protein [Roseivirga sp.]MBO6662340.1 DUF3108 domain-containing protein [Roseivirga sp.]MBO6762412.1 DUF3108 domain-containing protein [Roseivirga sp.]MBO6910284.1 DUF3108 domain-containing protein [Roseivirga sp.]
MKKTLLAIFLLTAFGLKAQKYELSKEIPFQPGEKIELKATVGFIRAAEATFSVSDVIYTINNKPTWKIDINAKTVGVFEFFSSVRDNWGTYYDTTSLVPQQFYRYIKEGRFRKNEILYFDHDKDSVTVAKLHKETMKLESQKDHAIPENVQDMVSGYYYLRSIDFDKIKEGELIVINTFFDDKQKPFAVKFMGREVLKTKLGDVNALVLVPMMKKDSLFEEDNTLKIWLSDDLNKIPLKVQAKIYVGYLNVELKNVENLRHPLSIIE